MSLPIITTTEDNAVDLQPWLLIRTLADAQVEASLWSIAEVGLALSIFSTRERAELYCTSVLKAGDEHHSPLEVNFNWKSVQPPEIEFGKLLVQHYRAGIKWIVLDPSERDAKRVFSMADVLRALRDKLSTQT